MKPTNARAINKPRLWFGFAAPLLALAFGLPVSVGIALNGIRGVIAFALLLLVALPIAGFISRREPAWLTLRWRGWWMKPIYDAGKSEPFRLHIK